MPPEQLDEVKRWLAKAGEDLRAGAVDLSASPPLIEDTLFHATTRHTIRMILFDAE